MTNNLPPWRPIADGLARHNDDTGEPAQTREEVRERYEVEAKAIAYEIATEEASSIDPKEIRHKTEGGPGTATGRGSWE